MDLNSMLNTGPVPDKKSSQSSSPVTQRYQPGPPHASPGANVMPAPFGSLSSQQTNPLYAPPSQDLRSSTGGSFAPQARGPTPLQTPTYTHPSGQYPFPQHPAQSPAPQQSHVPPYSPYGAQPVVTPGGRPSSHGYQQQPPTPGQMHPGGPPPIFQHHTHSMSPTPPSHHSQTPHSVRHSPLSGTIGQLPSQPHSQLQYQHTQPSTPLGPPPVHFSRTSTHGSHPDLQSPYHQRTHSGHSVSMISGSPAQHHPSVGNLIESPSVYNRQSPQMHRTSGAAEYVTQMERERSLSVSPKTMVPPRPSLSSRHSSQNSQQSFGARGSTQALGAPHMEAQSHVFQPQQPVAQWNPHSASQVSQGPALTTQISGSASANAAPQTPLSVVTPQHHAQKMGMNHLLTPTTERPSVNAAHEEFEPMSRVKQEGAFAKPSPAAAQATNGLPYDSPEHKLPSTLLQQKPPHNGRSDTNGNAEMKPSIRDLDSRKRPAESEVTEQPTKRNKRQYTERPIWARLARSNPQFTGTGAQNGTAQAYPPQQQQRGNDRASAQTQQQTRRPMQQINGAPHPPPRANGVDMELPPWLQDPPVDTDLAKARRVLGGWERSFRWQTPIPDMLKVVQTWFWNTMSNNSDIGTDARIGTIEIEAKIGTLVSQSTGERANLSVGSMAVIPAAANNKFRFESQIQEAEHQLMNNYLNEATRESQAPGRVPIKYKHTHETDSFAVLSPAGMRALPPSVHQRSLHGRELRLRTSTDSKTGRVIARIIKVPLDHLHIFNPNEPYDCRISINLEVNLDRPDFDPQDLVEPPSMDKPAPLARIKDRLSYKHLAYSVDLTKVEMQGMAPKYELELEVDANTLRQQMALLEAGQENGFAEVVSGFLDNATFLMKQRA